MAGVNVRLGIDSAGPHLALALWSPERGVLAARAPQVGRAHAARIVPELEALLDQAGLAPDALAAVTVGTGPGSYTGLRVGIAAARGLATGLSLPLGGIDSLALVAWAALAPGETGVAVLDARRGNVYAGSYRRDGDTLVRLRDPAKLPREEARAQDPDARWLEGIAPSAVWAAMQRPGRQEAVPVYL